MICLHFIPLYSFSLVRRDSFSNMLYSTDQLSNSVWDTSGQRDSSYFKTLKQLRKDGLHDTSSILKVASPRKWLMKSGDGQKNNVDSRYRGFEAVPTIVSGQKADQSVTNSKVIRHSIADVGRHQKRQIVSSSDNGLTPVLYDNPENSKFMLKRRRSKSPSGGKFTKSQPERIIYSSFQARSSRGKITNPFGGLRKSMKLEVSCETVKIFYNPYLKKHQINRSVYAN